MTTSMSTAELAGAGAGFRRARIAHAITNVLSPPALALPALLLAVWLTDDPRAWRFGAVYLVIGFLVPLADVIRLLRAGRISDFHLHDRRDRRRPFMVAIACNVVALGVLVVTGAPTMMVVLLRAMLLEGAVLLLITLAWQVSVHSASIAAFATLAVLALGSSASGVILLVPIVGWARVYLGRHTVAQVVTGTVIGSGALLAGVHGALW